MAEYLIIKREKCDYCDDGRPPGLCSKCAGLGYIETQVPLLEALRELGFFTDGERVVGLELPK